jgi:hypothetical protein
LQAWHWLPASWNPSRQAWHTFAAVQSRQLLALQAVQELELGKKPCRQERQVRVVVVHCRQLASQGRQNPPCRANPFLQVKQLLNSEQTRQLFMHSWQPPSK